MIPTPPLAQIPERLPKIKNMLLAAWRPQGAASEEHDPESLIRLLGELFIMLVKLDQHYGVTAPLPDDDATRLGDTGLLILAELTNMSQQLGIPQVKSELDLLAVTIGDWIIRHNGEIRTLEPIVNGLAVMANELHEGPTLEDMAAFMDQAIKSTAPDIVADTNKTDSGRPWRVLHLNRAIVATRSHNTELMAKVFDELIQGLPEDASEFFREGMRQMEVVDYPAKVRAVMTHYFQALTQHTLH
ncbi:MAG TPA: hypothetical protein VMV40_10380 [Acidiferrobacter sp.]|nr:hypothetical protein [Acidiferrobacter sp.]